MTTSEPYVVPAETHYREIYVVSLLDTKIDFSTNGCTISLISDPWGALQRIGLWWSQWRELIPPRRWSEQRTEEKIDNELDDYSEDGCFEEGGERWKDTSGEFCNENGTSFNLVFVSSAMAPSLLASAQIWVPVICTKSLHDAPLILWLNLIFKHPLFEMLAIWLLNEHCRKPRKK